MAKQGNLIAPALSVALMVMCGSSTIAQTVGVSSSVVNDVRMTTQAQPTLHKAVVKERVSLGNDVVTGRASMLQVLLLDRSTFTVGPNSRIRVDRFVYDPNRKASAVGLSVTKGAFRFISGKATHANPGQSKITTPIGSIGIRGTIVEGAVGEDALMILRSQPGFPKGLKIDPETASLVLLRGPGANAQGETRGAIDVAGQAGESVPVEQAGYAVFIPGPGETPFGPFQLSPEASAILSGLLSGRYLKVGPDGVTPLPIPMNPLVDTFFEVEQIDQESPGPGPTNPDPFPTNPNPSPTNPDPFPTSPAPFPTSPGGSGSPPFNP